MYLSINILLGIEPARRDDLESLMYIIVFLMKGRLPWVKLKLNKKDLNELLKAKLAIKP
jgi:casein kinase I family protein HRR25